MLRTSISHPTQTNTITAILKTCLNCQCIFKLSQQDTSFYTKISPTFADQKFEISIPTLCPICRQRRRLSFRNERNLYRRTCDASGKQMISIYSPDKPYKVYDQRIRWSDARDAMIYTRDFDFGKSFTENFDVLMHEVPHMSLSTDNCEGCDYANFVLDSKQCYLLYGGGNDDMVMYSDFVNTSNNCIDLSFCSACEYCFQCINCQSCFACTYSINCHNSSNLIGCTDCESCSYCYQSQGLSHVSYCFQNIQYSKEEYLQKIGSIVLSHDLYSKSQDSHIIGSEDCHGMNIINSKGCFACHDINNADKLYYCSFVPNAVSCYDLDFMAPFGSEYSYELCTSTGTKYSMSCYLSRLCVSCYYCFECRSCEHCFGCIGLRNKSYCIFNKQYSKDDYEKTVAKIITHMIETGERGEFFHPSLSPFGYNETVAQEYYPIGKDMLLEYPQEECITNVSLQQFGYHRSSYESPTPVSDKVIQGKDLPSTIEKVEDTILQYAIACEETAKLFRIQAQELAFYRKYGIPLPRKHPDQRHLERLALRK